MAVLPHHLTQSMAGATPTGRSFPYRMPYRYGCSARLCRPGWFLNQTRPAEKHAHELLDERLIGPFVRDLGACRSTVLVGADRPYRAMASIQGSNEQ